MTLRAARWPDDLPLLAGIDTSFTTDRIYRVVRDELSFTLIEEPVGPPLLKEFGSVTDDTRLPEMGYVAVAEQDGVLAGVVAAEYEAWKRRMAIRHLYVATGYRGRGIGRALLDRIESLARSAGARCLWLDTSNANYPAIQFYQRVGFRLCGVDLSFYDPEGPAQKEIGLFFVRELPGEAVHSPEGLTGRP
jgi:GNAT superfamily N-acetyltransferase